MENDVLVSIIIPLFNKENCIAHTINSIISQDFIKFEIVVIDDGSTDNSRTVVNSINDSRIRYFYKDNGGVSSARNYGVGKAQSEWILFLDADDILLQHSLSTLFSIATAYEQEVNIVSGNYISTLNGKVKLYNQSKYKGKVPNNFKWYYLNRFSMRMGCALIKRELIYNNPFNETLSRFEDLECILRLLKIATVFTIPDIVLEYCCDNNSLSKAVKDNYEKDFTFSMHFENKNFWEKCKLGEVLMLAWFNYPNARFSLFRLYRYNIIFAVIGKIKILMQKRVRLRCLNCCFFVKE